MRFLGIFFFSVFCCFMTLSRAGAPVAKGEGCSRVDVELLVTSLKEVDRFQRLARRLEQALAAPQATQEEAKRKYWLFERLGKDAKSRAKKMGKWVRSRDVVKMMVALQRACVQEQKKVSYAPWLTTGKKMLFGIGIPTLILMSAGAFLWHKQVVKKSMRVLTAELMPQIGNARLAQRIAEQNLDDLRRQYRMSTERISRLNDQISARSAELSTIQQQREDEKAVFLQHFRDILLVLHYYQGGGRQPLFSAGHNNWILPTWKLAKNNLSGDDLADARAWLSRALMEGVASEDYPIASAPYTDFLRYERECDATPFKECGLCLEDSSSLLRDNTFLAYFMHCGHACCITCAMAHFNSREAGLGFCPFCRNIHTKKECIRVPAADILSSGESPAGTAAEAETLA